MAIKWLSSNDAWLRYHGIEVDVTSAADEDWIILKYEGGRAIPPDATATVCIDIDVAGSGYLEFTTNSFQSMVDGTANSLIWAQGTVTESTCACFPGITGIRPRWVSGAFKVSILI